MQGWLFYGIFRGSWKWNRPGTQASMVIASIVHMNTCTWWHLSQSHLPYGKKKERQDIFIVVTRFLQEFLLSLFPLVFGFIFLPSLAFKICGFVHAPFEHFCHLTYGLLLMSQESNFLKKTLFIVFGVKLRILLHFPLGGSCSQIWH